MITHRHTQHTRQQVSKLDTDPLSHTARPSAPAPAKLQAPRSPTTFRKQDYAWWYGEQSSAREDGPCTTTLLHWYGAEMDRPGQQELGVDGHEMNHIPDEEDTQQLDAQDQGAERQGAEQLDAAELHKAQAAQLPTTSRWETLATVGTPLRAAPSLTLSQVDPAVLAELPPAIQQELVSALHRSALAGLHQRPRQARLDTMMGTSSKTSCGGGDWQQRVDWQEIDFDVLRQLPADIRMEVEASIGW